MGWLFSCSHKFKCAWVERIISMEKVKFYSNLLKLNLQRFADEGQDGEGGADTENKATDTNDSSDTQTKPFMTFQTQSELDSYFDKKLNKALGTAKANWEKEQSDKAKKAKDRKNMTEEERREDDFKQREEALSAREADVTKRENRSKLASRLVDDGLPTGLVDVFDDVLANEDNMNETYERVSEVFRSAVHDAVEARLAQGSRTPKSTDDNLTHKSAGELYAEKANSANKSESDFWK